MWTNLTILAATAVAAKLNDTAGPRPSAAEASIPWWIEEVVGGVIAFIAVVIIAATIVKKYTEFFEGALQRIHVQLYKIARFFTRAEDQPPANSSATFPMEPVGSEPFPRVPYLTDDMRVEMEARRQQLLHLYEQGCRGNRAAWV